MKSEIEAKFLITHTSISEMRTHLSNVGAHVATPERTMMRSLFGKEKNNLLDADYIRVRDEGGTVTLSAKKHTVVDGDPHDNLELVVTVSEYQTTLKILEQAGLTKTNEQETKRESWKLGDVDIEIDTWPGLDPYIEIEAPDIAALERTAVLLGFQWEDRIVSSVEDIYMQLHSLDRETVREGLAFCTFAKPPFQNRN